MKASELIVKCLENENVDYIFDYRVRRTWI